MAATRLNAAFADLLLKEASGRPGCMHAPAWEWSSVGPFLVPRKIRAQRCFRLFFVKYNIVLIFFFSAKFAHFNFFVSHRLFCI